MATVAVPRELDFPAACVLAESMDRRKLEIGDAIALSQKECDELRAELAAVSADQARLREIMKRVWSVDASVLHVTRDTAGRIRKLAPYCEEGPLLAFLMDQQKLQLQQSGRDVHISMPAA